MKLATNLRGRPVEQKATICAEVVERIWPMVEAGEVKAVVQDVLPLAEAAEAHRLMESGTHTGKILLTTAG
jgi:NADPH:quinone reductase-like Zn-dependent oxidoreductase